MIKCRRIVSAPPLYIKHVHTWSFVSHWQITGNICLRHGCQLYEHEFTSVETNSLSQATILDTISHTTLFSLPCIPKVDISQSGREEATLREKTLYGKNQSPRRRCRSKQATLVHIMVQKSILRKPRATRIPSKLCQKPLRHGAQI